MRLEAEARKDAEKASLLVKARRLAVAATGVTPSFLQNRVAQGNPLPRLLLGRVVWTPVGGDGPDEDDAQSRALQSLCAFIIGMGGATREGMPRDVFRGVVMDLLCGPTHARVGPAPVERAPPPPFARTCWGW